MFCENCEGREDLAWDAPMVFGENRLNPICLSWDMDVRLGFFGVDSRRTIGNITVNVWHPTSVYCALCCEEFTSTIPEGLLGIDTVNV